MREEARHICAKLFCFALQLVPSRLSFACSVVNDNLELLFQMNASLSLSLSLFFLFF